MTGGRDNPRASPTAEDLAGDVIKPGDPLFGTIWINPQRMSGAPCFYGTRVPIKNLFDYLAAGRTIDQFLDDFPLVTRDQVRVVLARASEHFYAPGRAA
jgi:uncharacterized protein (DUF433 family)